MWTDYEAERRLLANILLSKESWELVQEHFQTDVFAYPEMRAVADSIKELMDEGRKPSMTLVARRARKRDVEAKDLLRLTETIVINSEVPELWEYLHDLWRKRLALEKLQAAVSKIERGDGTTDEVLATAQDALLSAFEEEARGVKDWREVLEELHEIQELAQRNELEEAIPIGLPVLESIMGGLIKGRQYLVAGRPSMGKSALAMNIVKAVARNGRRCLVYSPEQQNREFAARALAAEGPIPAHRIGTKLRDDEYHAFSTSLTKAQEWPLRMVDEPKPTIERIKQLARAEKARHPNLELIVIDYLGECDVREEKHGGLQQATGKAVSELRGLAKELGVAQIVVSQLSRKLESRDDKRPMMSDLRESGRLEEVADAVMFLYRHGYYHPGFMGSDYGDQITEIKVGKDRQGGAAGKEVACRFSPEYMKFEPLDERWYGKYVGALSA